MKETGLQEIKKYLRSITIIFEIFREFIKDNCIQVAASLTFTTLLSLVPLVTISLSVLSRFKASQDAFLNLIFQYLIPTPYLKEIILTNIQQFAQQMTTLSIIGGLFLIFTSISLLNTIEGTFNKIWGVSERRQFVSKFTAFWSVITLSPVLIVVAMIFSLEIATAPFVSDILKMPEVQGALNLSLSFLLIFFAIFIIYRILPNTRVRLIPAISGAVIATSLFQVARWGFEFYIIEFARFDKIYGIIGAMPMFFIWIYICWVVILFGAEVTYTVQNIRLALYEKKFTERQYRGYYGLRVIMVIGRNFLKGVGATQLDSLVEELNIPYSYLSMILSCLAERELVHSVDGDAVFYLPAKSLSRMTVREVVEAVQGNPFHFPASSTHSRDAKTIKQFFEKAQRGLARSLKGVTIEIMLR